MVPYALLDTCWYSRAHVACVYCHETVNCRIKLHFSLTFPTNTWDTAKIAPNHPDTRGRNNQDHGLRLDCPSPRSTGGRNVRDLCIHVFEMTQVRWGTVEAQSIFPLYPGA